MKPIVMTRRVTLVIIAIAISASLVSGALLSNYLLPSTVTITSSPGLSVYVGVLSSNTCTTTAVTTYDWGDVQISQSKSSLVVCIANTGGAVNQYLLDGFSSTNAVVSSLATQNLPNGVTLTWNFASVAGSGINCIGSTFNGHCIGIAPGSQTPPITLTLTVSSSASPSATPYSFTTVFQSYDSMNG
jgi:hypothetical protein